MERQRRIIWYKPWHPYAFILLAIVGLFIFRLGPMAFAFVMSFTRWDLLTSPEWIGITNYLELFTTGDFWVVVKNTFVFALVYVPGGLLVGLLLALLINVKVKGIGFFRALFFSPLVTSAVAIGMVWNWILSPQYGIFNYLLEVIFHVEGISWLGNSATALIAIAAIFVWKEAGFYMIIYLAGLQNIPVNLYEASATDGASKFQKLRWITLPLLTPTTFFALVISLFRMLRHFELIYAMTRGGPGIASTTLPYSIYQNAFIFYRIGYASAIAYVLVLLVGVVTLINFYYKRYWVKYQY
ncbi:MAG: sugar ABC transporter permease [candidate division WOR-3 bacterium]|nr:sugar ABC transporter permease [candidate division WOR-3 bacterium]